MIIIISVIIIIILLAQHEFYSSIRKERDFYKNFYYERLRIDNIANKVRELELNPERINQTTDIESVKAYFNLHPEVKHSKNPWFTSKEVPMKKKGKGKKGC